jgi:hypothetical protein
MTMTSTATDETTVIAIVADLIKMNEYKSLSIADIADLDILVLMTPDCTCAAAAADDAELVRRHSLELDTLRPTESKSET